MTQLWGCVSSGEAQESEKGALRLSSSLKNICLLQILEGGAEEYIWGEHPVSRANCCLHGPSFQSLYLKVPCVLPTREVICPVHANKGPIFQEHVYQVCVVSLTSIAKLRSPSPEEAAVAFLDIVETDQLLFSNSPSRDHSHSAKSPVPVLLFLCTTACKLPLFPQISRGNHYCVVYDEEESVILLL